MEHLKTGSLIEYAEDLLAGNGTSDLDSHLHECSQCAAAASEWLGLLGLMRATPLQSGPEDAVQKCKSLYHFVRPVHGQTETVAEMVLDSVHEQDAVGVRGVSESQQIHLQTSTTDIHLCVFGVPPVMLGQLIGRPGGAFVKGARVELLHASESREMTVSDALGEFRFGNVPHGNSSIRAQLPSGVCVIGSFIIPTEDNHE
jgi:hypothetical protein